jgi:D-beta-D-heptose 7-phosphate kinase/D-beta-D-heptose 1-phosphate adenosyltransferase
MNLSKCACNKKITCNYHRINVSKHIELYKDFLNYGIERKNIYNDPVVLVNGTFTLLHPGHFSLFRFAKTCVNEGKNFVVVAMNANSSVKRIKGEHKIFFDNLDRYDMVRDIKWVDSVCLFYEDTPQELINVIKPSYIVKSQEYQDKVVVGEDVAEVVFAPHNDKYSTTKLIEKIKNG